MSKALHMNRLKPSVWYLILNSSISDKVEDHRQRQPCTYRVLSLLPHPAMRNDPGTVAQADDAFCRHKIITYWRSTVVLLTFRKVSSVKIAKIKAKIKCARYLGSVMFLLLLDVIAKLKQVLLDGRPTSIKVPRKHL